MTEPTGPVGPDPHRLDRAPGERYRGTRPPAQPATTARSPEGSARRGILAALSAATAIAVARALVGQLDLGPGTLAIAAFAGWLVALGLIWGAAGARIGRRGLLAALIAAASIAVGLVLESLFARLGGGVLGPLEYVAARYGLLGYAEILVAASVAWIRAR